MPGGMYRRDDPVKVVRTELETGLGLGDLDPDIAMWPTTPVQRWPFTGPPTEGIFPLGWMGIDNTATLWICVQGGSPGVWTSSGGSRGLVFLDPLGADPTGVVDLAAAITEGLAALPTQTYINPGDIAQGGSQPASFWTYPSGQLWLGPGQYAINKTTPMPTLPPCVELWGMGEGVTNLVDYNQNGPTGSNLVTPANCGVNFYNPNFYPGDQGHPYGGQMVGGIWYPGLQFVRCGIFGIALDGTNTAPGCCGVGFRCAESTASRIMVQNYPGPSFVPGWGSGLAIFSSGWNETWDHQIVSVNNAAAVSFNSRTTDVGANSQSQGRLDVILRAPPGGHGIVVHNGAWVYNAELRMRGLMQIGTIPSNWRTGRAIWVTDNNSLIEWSTLQVRLESDPLDGDSGTTPPQTINIGTGAGGILDCDGGLRFANFNSNPWSPINNDTDFQFTGVVNGDTTMAPGGPTFLKVSN